MTHIHDLLVIDTATEACSVAVFDAGNLVAGHFETLGRGHAESLIPMIEALPDMGRASEIWVNIGPGSFTGIRVGIAAAKALALAWDTKLRGYACHDLVAAIAVSKGIALPMCVVMQGGHGEYFVRNYDNDGHGDGPILSLLPQEARNKAGPNQVAGNVASALKDKFPDIDACQVFPDARQAMLLSPDILADPSPMYVRPPDAKLPKIVTTS